MLSSLLAILLVSTPNPLGVMIRPAFFKNLAATFNARPLGVKVENCWANIRVSGQLSFTLDEPRWEGEQNSELVLSVPVNGFTFDGFIKKGCEDSADVSYPLHVASAAFPLALALDPHRLIRPSSETLIRVDPNNEASGVFDPEIQILDPISKKPLGIIPDFYNKTSLREGLWEYLRSLVANKFSSWVQERIRGFVMVESIADLMEDSPLWRDGPVVSRGGLTIDLDGPPLSKRKTLFSTTPFQTGSTFISDKGLEVYTNARFLNDEDLFRIHGEDLNSMSLTDVEQKSRDYLTNPLHWTTAPFSRPQIKPSTSDLSLVVPTALINEALQTVYREGLLRFKTTIRLGKQTQGIITPEAPEVSTIVGISPLSAPGISFLAKQPILQIKDYMLDISTAIEDRLIPSSRIMTNASIEANLALDSVTQSVNLRLAPESFRMRLQDLTGRMTPAQTDIFERLANGLWRDFLGRYSNLVLFLSVIETQQADLQIVSIDVQESAIILDVNVNWEKLNL